MLLTGTVVGIYISPKGYVLGDRQSGKLAESTPMIALPVVRAFPRDGDILGGLESIDGIVDRYRAGIGLYSGKPTEKPKIRDITLIAEEAIVNSPYTAIQTKRNIVIRGIPLEYWDRFAEARFTIDNEIIIRGVDVCTPCEIPQLSLAARGIERPKFVESFTGSKGGLRGEILEGGIIRIGSQCITEIPG